VKTIHFSLNGTNLGIATTDANGVATKSAGLKTYLPGNYTIGVQALFAGDDAFNGSLGSASLQVLKIPTSLTVTPVSAANGSTVDLSATLIKTSESATVQGKTIAFNINGANVGSAVTDAGGVATLAGVSLSGNPAGTYPTGINARFMGDTYLEPCYGSAPLTINVGSGGWAPPSGQGATGGGWYTLTDRGRVTFSFNINPVPHAESAKYKGEFLLINDGRWRLKGTISYYQYKGNSQSEASGCGQLYLWDPASQGNQGGWVLFSDNAGFGIVFADLNTGKAKDSLNLDKFGINISIDIPEGAPPLPRSSPAELEGGNIDIKDIDHNAPTLPGIF